MIGALPMKSGLFAFVRLAQNMGVFLETRSTPAEPPIPIRWGQSGHCQKARNFLLSTTPLSSPDSAWKTRSRRESAYFS